jgi:hypothetical protein
MRAERVGPPRHRVNASHQRLLEIRDLTAAERIVK